MILSWHQDNLIHGARFFSSVFAPKSDWQGIVKGQTPAPLTPKGKEN